MELLFLQATIDRSVAALTQGVLTALDATAGTLYCGLTRNWSGERSSDMSLVATEHVLVVPTAVFHRLGHFQGFSGDTEKYLRGLLDPAHTSYQPRATME